MPLGIGLALYLAAFFLLLHLVDRLATRPSDGEEGSAPQGERP